MQPATGAARVLVVDDEPEMGEYLQMSLQCHGFSVDNAQDGQDALQILEQSGDFSLVLMDVMLPRMNGIETLRQLRNSPRHRTLPVIMVSGVSSTNTVVEAMKSGATDFLVKPVSHGALAAAVENALSAAARRPQAAGADNGKPRTSTETVTYFPGWMAEIDGFLHQVGASDAPVLIQGETGVGKEVLAQLLHTRSERAGKPFLKLNCAALPSELVESELFGFERGAFTGAFKSKPGKFDLAHTGTILLDEIGDMDFRLQAKLLQVVQDQQFERLGGRETVRVNVRVLAATHCDLEQAITAGRFREDLYHRLNVINIRVPSLRERTDEILPLAEFLLAKYTTRGECAPEIPAELRRALLAYSWPGNIRELENFMRKFQVLRDAELAVTELKSRAERREKNAAPAPAAAAAPSTANNGSFASLSKVNEVQRRIEADTILTALNETHWNRKLAAARLNVDYKALLYKMKKLGIDAAENHATAHSV